MLERLSRHPGRYALTDISPRIALPVLALTCGDDPRIARFAPPRDVTGMMPRETLLALAARLQAAVTAR